LEADPAYAPPRGTPGLVTDLGEFFMPLEGLVDVEAEKVRLEKEIEKLATELEKSERKLGNDKFVANAKPEVVKQERDRLANWKGKIAQLTELRAAL